MNYFEKFGLVLMIISASAGMIGSSQAGWGAFFTFAVGMGLFLACGKEPK